jgi:hypothetical protein
MRAQVMIAEGRAGGVTGPRNALIVRGEPSALSILNVRVKIPRELKAIPRQGKVAVPEDLAWTRH